MSRLRPEEPSDYTVMELEVLWWVEDCLFDITRPHNWCWNAMILQPGHITTEIFQEARAKL